MDSARAILEHGLESKEKVCRNLFGPVDHEQLKRDSEHIMKKEVEEASEKWNFDFAKQTPLEGRYQWEKINYLEKEYVDCSDLVSQEQCQGCENTGSNDRDRRQTLMTDYFSVTKSHSSSPPPRSPKP